MRQILTAGLILPVIAMFAAMVAAAPQPRSVEVGHPHHPAALAKEVQQAYRDGAKVIVIRPGTYQLPATGQSTFNLDHWNNVTIRADGVTLIMRVRHAGNCFQLNHCNQVTIEGPTISQTRVTFYQGRVMSVDKIRHGYTCIWRPDRGYPFPNAARRKSFPRGFDVVNGRTLHLRVGSGDIGAARFASAGSHAFRLTFRASHSEFKVGDFLVARYGNAFQKVVLNHSRHCTIKNITMMRNGFAPIFENGGGANRIIACRWVLGPKPAGARTNPVVTNQADGFHCVNAYPGPELKNCVMTGVFLDDCIAIHGEFQAVVGASGNTITVKDNRSARLTVGQPIQISSVHGFFAIAKVLAINTFEIRTRRQARQYDHVSPLAGAGPPHKPPGIGDRLSRITLSRRLIVPAGAYVTNPLRCGSGYKVIGCHIGDTRSRGMLLKGSDGLVENNVVRGCGMAGISIGPEVWWREAGYCSHVMVEHNTLIRDGKAGPGGYFSAVYVHGRGAIGNSHIIIQHNVFRSNFSGDVFMQWSRHSAIKHNVMTGPTRPAFSGEKRQPAIVVKNSRHIVIRANHLTNPGAYKNPPIETSGR